MQDPNHLGSVAEAGFVFHAVKAGLPVLAPVAEHGAYDAVLDVEGRLIRVQVKCGTLVDGGSVIVARLRRSRHSPTAGYVIRAYGLDEIDAFAIYCAELDRCYLVPIDDVAGQGSLHLRIDPPANSQRASLRFAADYEFPGAVAQLGERSAGSRKVVGSSPISSTEGSPGTESPCSVGAHEFRNRFGWYMERAAAGETIHVSRRGKPYVRLLPSQDELPGARVDVA
jgi:prevent-host-death family protein